MVHLATFNHLVMKTDNGAYGNAEFRDMEDLKCCFEIGYS